MKSWSILLFLVNSSGSAAHMPKQSVQLCASDRVVLDVLCVGVRVDCATRELTGQRQ